MFFMDNYLLFFLNNVMMNNISDIAKSRKSIIAIIFSILGMFIIWLLKVRGICKKK